MLILGLMINIVCNITSQVHITELKERIFNEEKQKKKKKQRNKFKFTNFVIVVQCIKRDN